MEIYLIVILGGPFFARWTFALWEQPDFYFKNPMALFQIWEGGFVYFGGMVGSLVLTWFYLRRLKQALWPWLDFFAPVLSLGYALGRLGCLWAGCCYGQICELPWAMRFPLIDENFRHPTQFYAFLLEMIAFVGVLALSKYSVKNSSLAQRLRPGFVFAVWLVLHGAGRLVMELFRDDARGPTIVGFTLGQWMATVVVISGFVFGIKKSTGR